MGELWRSQEMQLVQFFIQSEAAHDTVDELGKLGLVEFRDLNPHINAFQRNFVNEVKRADEMERKLKYFSSQIEEFNGTLTDATKKIKLADINEEVVEKSNIDELETKFEEMEKQLIDLNNHQQTLLRNRTQLVELHHVLEKDAKFFNQQATDEVTSGEEVELATRGLSYVTGVIARDKFTVFERVVFRSSRGNVYIQYAEIQDDPVEEEVAPGGHREPRKNVFIIFFHAKALEAKIKKIAESFFANLYPCPISSQERKELSEQVTVRIEELKLLIIRGDAQRSELLTNLGIVLKSWTQLVKQEKAIYHHMNMFNYDHGRKCLVAEGWIPAGITDAIEKALKIGFQRSGAGSPSVLNPIKARDEPPTYFRTDKYTEAFQNMINSYGMARYQEINPAVFTMITFPWQFGIMFGDVGHGIILTLFGIFMIYKEKEWEKKKISEMIEMFYAGRYLIVLMGLFSIYQGFLYNEFFFITDEFWFCMAINYE